MPLLRIAVRDLTRHRVRSLVALLLFALPVALIVGFCSLKEADQRISLGDPTVGSAAVSFTDGEGRPTVDPADQSARLHDLLGPDADSLSRETTADGVLTTGSSGDRAGDRRVDTRVRSLQASADGTGPAVAPGTVVLGGTTAYLLGVGTGDTVTVATSDGRPSTDLTVAAVTDAGSDAVVDAGDVPPASGTTAGSSTGTAPSVTWYLPADAPDTLTTTLRNAAHTPDSVLDFGEHWTDGPYLLDYGDLTVGAVRDWVGYTTDMVAQTLALLIAAVLVVTLIAAVITPVFAVAAHRLTRQLGLLCVNGASPRQLRRIMFYEGLVTGVLGTALGLAGSAGVGALAISRLSAGSYAWAWDVALPVAVIAVACGLAAALVPARRAGRTDPVVAVAGGDLQGLRAPGTPAARYTRRARCLTGPVLLVLGLVLVALGGADPDEANPFTAWLGGISLAGIGLTCSAGPAVRLLARAGTHLPTAGRLAVRDSARNRHRTVPALAAVAGVTMLVTVLVTRPFAGFDAPETTFRDTVVTADALAGAVGTTADTGRDAYAADLDRLADRLGVTDADRRTDLYSAVRATPDNSHAWNYPEVTVPGDDGWQPVFEGPGWGTVMITDGPMLGLYAGVTTADVREAAGLLARGTAVVGEPALVTDGTVLIDGRRVPAVVLPALGGHGGVAVSERTARDLGLVPEYSGTAFTLDRPVPAWKAALVTVADLDNPYLSLTTPAVSGAEALLLGVPVLFGMLLTLGTVLLVVLLAASESRRDLATVTAVGAPPGLLRRFTATQALVVAGTGTVAGVVVGVLPAVFAGEVTGFSGTQWWALAAVLVAGPLLAWVIGSTVGAVSARDRGPARRRD